MKISKFMMLAGAALSIGSVAMAQNTDKDRAYAGELLTDASVRTSQLGAASKGMMIGEGVNTLRIGGSVIARYNLNFRNDDTLAGGSTATPPDNEGFTHGFNIPLVHLNFGGNVATEGLTYFIQGAFTDMGSTGDGTSTAALEEAFINYDYGNGFALRGGQFKFGFDRNTSLDNETLLIPNWYAPTGRFFSHGYSQGVQGTYASDQFRVMFGFNDGANQSNTNFNAASESDYGFNVRGEWQAMGAPNWSVWNYDTSFRSQADMALLIGAGIFVQGGGSTGAVGGKTAPDQDSISYTLDLTLKDAGWHAAIAGYGRHISQTGAASDLDDFGFFVQGGIFVADQWELFARLDAIFPDDNYVPGGNIEDAWFLTAGVNYYVVPESQAAIINACVTYAFNDTAVGGASSSGPVSVGGSAVPGGLSNLNLANGSAGFLGDADDGEFGVAVTAMIRF